MSTSCPDLTSLTSAGQLVSKSLPVNLDPKSIFGARLPPSSTTAGGVLISPGGDSDGGRRGMAAVRSPATPPPSVCTSPLPTRLRKDVYFRLRVKAVKVIRQ